ncbi:YfhE family protein [Neobacillus sp. D3-1R]
MSKSGKKDKVRSNLTSMQAVTYSNEFRRADRAAGYTQKSTR